VTNESERECIVCAEGQCGVWFVVWSNPEVPGRRFSELRWVVEALPIGSRRVKTVLANGKE